MGKLWNTRLREKNCRGTWDTLDWNSNCEKTWATKDWKSNCGEPGLPETVGEVLLQMSVRVILGNWAK